MILLVVDMQEGIVDEELYNYDAFLAKTVRLIDTARKNGVEVVYVRHDAGPGSGLSAGDEAFEIAARVSPAKGEKVFTKTINSCFGNLEFREYMEQRFHLRAERQTTAEFMADLERGSGNLSREHRDFLRNFLTAADMVKFARVSADRSLFEDAAGKAGELIRATAPHEDGKENKP